MTDQPTPSRRADAVTLLPLLESARHLGHASWLEGRLYEVVGSWAVDAVEAAATVALAVQADRHAARSAVWFERLPELRELPAAQLVVPSDAGSVLVDQLDGVGGTPERCAVLARVVLPALADAYRGLAAAMSPIADGPALGCLHRAVDELGAEVARLGEVVPGTRLPPPGADVVDQLATAVVSAGPLLGPTAGFDRTLQSY